MTTKKLPPTIAYCYECGSKLINSKGVILCGRLRFSSQPCPEEGIHPDCPLEDYEPESIPLTDESLNRRIEGLKEALAKTNINNMQLKEENTQLKKQVIIAEQDKILLEKVRYVLPYVKRLLEE